MAVGAVYLFGSNPMNALTTKTLKTLGTFELSHKTGTDGDWVLAERIPLMLDGDRFVLPDDVSPLTLGGVLDYLVHRDDRFLAHLDNVTHLFARRVGGQLDKADDLREIMDMWVMEAVQPTLLKALAKHGTDTQKILRWKLVFIWNTEEWKIPERRWEYKPKPVEYQLVTS